MSTDFLPIKGTDHIEFYVGNAKQSTMFYQTALGFQLVAYQGPETGTKEKASYMLEQGKVRFVLTSPLYEDSPITEHIKKHGDGVKVLALWVDDAEKSYHETIKRGAASVFEPKIIEDDDGKVVMSAIKTYGDTIHKFVQRNDYNGPFLPGFQSKNGFHSSPIGLKYVDHCVGNVELNILFKTDGLTGTHQKSITIWTNDPVRPTHRLIVKVYLNK